MPLTLSGTLKDGLGNALPGAKIVFQARTTSLGVLQGITAIAQSDQSGTYSLSVELGTYDIYVQSSTEPRQRYLQAKSVVINDAVTAEDLNQLIVDSEGYDDLTPQIVIEFQAIRDDARGYRDEAAASASAADADATATAADARATAADRQQTGLDAQATAADRQQTMSDAQATAADRQQTGDDASATAADRAHVDDQRQAVDTAAGNASASASAAAVSETAAGDHALEAEHWAGYPVDTPVPEGDGTQKSAMHWAEIARQRAVSAMVAQGAWDASSGALPPEPAGASYWLVTGASSGVTIGGVEYRNKDMVLWTPDGSGGGAWSKIDNTDSVASVAGKTGAVTLVPSDAGADPAGTADAAVAAHTGETDPHAQYVQKASGKGLSTNDYTDAEKAKLGGVEGGATQNAADADLRDRATHTGTQPLSTISDAGTAASEDAGTGDNQLPTVQQIRDTFDIHVPDPERRAVEAATGGRCTIIRAPDGQASYMHVIPKFRCEDVAPGGELGTGVHPAFLVNGVEKDSFMVGMYQAFKDGAHYVSQPQRAPHNYIDFDAARAGMQSNGSGWHLMSNWEWAAIALWCMANGYQPTGNTNYGRSHANTWETGIREDGGVPGVSSGVAASLTGSGPNAWRHDASPAGIADLVGSVWEWQEGMKMVDGRIWLAADNDFNLSETGYTDSGFDMPSDHTWSTVDATGAGDLLKKALVVPNGVLDPYGRLYTNLSGERLPIRGGVWNNGSSAGLGALGLGIPRSNSYGNIGFRPAFITP